MALLGWFLCVLLLASGVCRSTASECILIWLNLRKLKFNPPSIVGLGRGCVEFSGMSFSLYLSSLPKDPDDSSRRYEVGRFINAGFWYVFPWEAAIVIVQCHCFPEPRLTTKKSVTLAFLITVQYTLIVQYSRGNENLQYRCSRSDTEPNQSFHSSANYVNDKIIA